MHACGHDIHMASWMGTARIMANSRKQWRGTLVLIGQPAEETVAGATRMLADGLLTRFPRPQFALAMHDDPRAPAGVIGYHAGPILSNVDSMKITIYGVGGHGARPDTAIDPIVIAARTVVTLQTIVAREVSPLDSAVVTVGNLHGGTKNNIIPAEATIGLTVRSLNDSVRQRVLKAVERIANSALREVVVTDTIPLSPSRQIDKLKVLSVAPLIGEAIKRIHRGESVGALFSSEVSFTQEMLLWEDGVGGGRREGTRQSAPPNDTTPADDDVPSPMPAPAGA